MFYSAWAKPESNSALPLADHGSDVAAVLSALLAAGWGDKFASILGRDLTGGEVARFRAIAFLHDMGKANVGFWRRQFDGAPRIGHLTAVLAPHRALRSRLADLGVMWGPIELPLAMLAHHGRPISDLSGRERDKLLWTRDEAHGYDPLAELDDLLEKARERFPDAFGPAAPIEDPRAVSLFAGLLTLADWIGSDMSRFPLDAVTGEARIGRSATTARTAIANLGLGHDAELRECAARASFHDAFDFTPRGLQAAAGEIGIGHLTILEAETGSGKTEAALWRFLRLFAAGEVDALYLALPTRTSAVQMHERVRDCMDNVFGAGAVSVALAVPGYLRAAKPRGNGWAKAFVRRDGYTTLPTRISAPLRRMAPEEWSRRLPELMLVFVLAGISVERHSPQETARWAALVHMIARLSGTGGVMAHAGSRRTGAAIFEAGYSEARLAKLLSARGAAHLDQCARLARFLAANGGVPLELRPLAALVLYAGLDEERAERARLTIAQA